MLNRNKDVPVNHRDFWYATYTLYSVSEAVDSEERLSDAASGSSASDQAPCGGQHTMVSFLKPVLKQIIMAGKSMQLLKNLNCKAGERPNSSSRGLCFCPPTPLSEHPYCLRGGTTETLLDLACSAFRLFIRLMTQSRC